MSERTKRVYRAITDAGYSYGELSKVTGIPKAALHRYATGATEKIPIDRLEKIARATGVAASYLMCWVDEPSGESEEPAFDISSTDLQFFKDYLSMSEQGKELARGMVDALKDKYKKQDILSNLENQIG